MEILKYLWKMKLSALFALGATGFFGHQIFSKGDLFNKSSEVFTGVDVKTLRQNPASFRSHYLPTIRYTGGK